jgi:tagatose-1,6-bisphosphate aldolase
MLAGRALWTNALASPDRRATLREESVPYLRSLSEVVAASARPWTAVS